MILPNFGPESSPVGIRAIAEAAEELGFHSVWTTEHIVVGPEGVNPYGRVYDSLVTLGWIAGWTERVGLGTSIVLVPLHNPFHLAKQVATLQELSGGRFTLGVGIGWHRDEYEFMGVEFEGRGRRADEAIRLMRSLWSGRGLFEGRYWSYRDATAEPHPSRGSDAAHVRSVREQHPELRTIPRVSSVEQVEPMLEAGADGAIVSFPDEAAMRELARRYR